MNEYFNLININTENFKIKTKTNLTTKWKLFISQAKLRTHVKFKYIYNRRVHTVV